MEELKIPEKKDPLNRAKEIAETLKESLGSIYQIHLAEGVSKERLQGYLDNTSTSLQSLRSALADIETKK